jgi:M3 family oligoendopeptidase
MKLVLSELEITLPDFDQLKESIKINTTAFINADTYDIAQKFADHHHEMMVRFVDMSSKSQLKFVDNMANEVALKDFSVFQEHNASVEQLDSEFNNAMVLSKFISDFSNHYGQRYIEILIHKEKLNAPDAIDLKLEESKLTTWYSELTSKAMFEIDGKQYNYGALGPLQSSSDRAMRKKVADVVIDFYHQHGTEIGDKFDQMVKLRNQIAKKSNLENTQDYTFLTMNRSGYTKNDIAAFRDNIAKYMVPLQEKINTIRKFNLGIDTITYYDSMVTFTDGGPKVLGTNEEKLAKGKKMYQEFSPEASSLYNKMLDQNLIQVENRPGKMGGGFATTLLKEKMPFIFTNFSGTDFDFIVLTHEFGHTFQFENAMKNSKNYNTYVPSYDCVEVFSHTMEFLTYPWIEDFFGLDSDKFRLDHLLRNARLLWSCSIADEFQQGVYENENWSDADRNKYFNDLKVKYNSVVNTDGNPKQNDGFSWKSNGHIVTRPFYIIDYALAICVAVQIFKIYQSDKQKALDIYNTICKNSAGMNIISLLEISGLSSPFDEATVKDVADILHSEIVMAFENYKSNLPTSVAI